MQATERENDRVSDRVSERLLEYEDSELVRIAQLQLPYVTTAYEVLFHRYHKPLMSLCYRYLGSKEEAEETVSDTMLNVFNTLHRFEQRASFKTWIYKIAYNLCMTRLRKKQLELEDIDGQDFAAEPDPSIDDQDDKHRVNKWLDHLSIEERTIVVFRVVACLEFSEIAHIVESKLSTVKMKYKRALAKHL